MVPLEPRCLYLPDSQSSVIDRMFNYDPSIDILIYGHTIIQLSGKRGTER